MEHSRVVVGPLGRAGRCYALIGLFALKGGALQKVNPVDKDVSINVG